MSQHTRRLVPSLEDWPHETPLVADDAACSLGKGVSGLAFRVGVTALPVIFVGRQTRKTEQSYGDIVGTFMWKKVAVVRSTEAFDQRNPQTGVGLELVKLVGNQSGSEGSR